jgi:aminoglycoside phosphotransferase (APT) family kinase protein
LRKNHCQLSPYSQNDWVRIQQYNESDWGALVELWSAYNRHLSDVIERIPRHAVSAPCNIGKPELSDCLQQYLAGRYPGATISDFQFITSGWESDVYTFTLRLPADAPKALIVRLYPGDGATEKLVCETCGLRRLHQAGYPVPAMLLYETDPAILGKPFAIMEKLEGKSLWPILAEATSSQAGHLLDRFGCLLARLHQLDWRPFTEHAACYEANPTAILDELCASLRQLYTRFDVVEFLTIVDWLEIHKSDITVRPAVVHLDFHANNVFLCSDDHLAVIDWTQITVSDYRADLSWTLMIMGDHGQPQWGERILRAYGLAANFPVEQLDYFNVITYTKLLASTVISLKTSPNKLGMRPETVESIKQQASTLKTLSRRIQHITGLTVPEIETALGHIS